MDPALVISVIAYIAKLSESLGAYMNKTATNEDLDRLRDASQQAHDELDIAILAEKQKQAGGQ